MSKQLFILDTSIIIKWLSADNENDLDRANAILSDVQTNRVEILAPELAKYEVGNVLLHGKNLSSPQAEVVLTEFYGLPIIFVPLSKEQAKETFRLAFNLTITYYDASFLSLAKNYEATLVTENIKHQGKTNDIKVIALKDYPSPQQL